MVAKIKIGLASDHGGYELKESIKSYLAEKGIETVDYGTNGPESVDYPEFAVKAAEGILEGEVDRCIIMCGSGIGISIAANKVPGIRAALVWDHYTAKMCRAHNNANIMVMGGRLITMDRAEEMVDVWLETEFEGGRHERRVGKLDELAKKYWVKYLEEK